MFAPLLLLAQAAAQPSPMPSFMTGCWIMQSGERTAEECWTRGNAGLMIGSGRVWTGDKMKHWEWMRVERGHDDQLTFFASPRGAPQTGFKAVKVTDSEITFENHAHDYPQRIRYWKTDQGISAETALADGSKPDRYDFKPMGGPAKPAN
ncbi:MAG: DUF6265 family protein [Sphingomicrobium sp.]